MFKRGKNSCRSVFSKTAILGLAFALLFSLVAVPQASAADQIVHELVIMGTTDSHSYIMPYDYLKDAEDQKIGLSKTATLVDQKRVQHANTLLLDAGDAIQGSMLAYLEAVVEPLKEGEVHSAIKAMNIMEYDAAVIGNHEFDFGLDFLQRAHEDAKFPMVNANVYIAGTDENYFTPYVLLDREVDGKPIKVGVIGFVPPQVTTWSKLHLEGKVEVKEIVETAEKFIPMMREAGADLIIAVGHTGIDVSETASENAGYQLSQVEGIDAMVLGHQHRLFPSDRYADIEGIDIEKGLINGVPTILPGSWGNSLGLIKLDLVNRDGVWEVVDSQSMIESVEEVEAKPSIVEFVAARHAATIDYVSAPVGTTVEDLNTFFGRVMDSKVTKLVNDAQLWYANNFFAGTEHENANLISSTAPFKIGRQGAHYFTNVEAGGIAVKDVADIYIYDNTLHVVKVNGQALKQWIERSADNFLQIDPSKTEDQILLDYAFAGYNFDVFTDIQYQIDVTQPSGSRVVNLSYEGEPVTADMEFLVVTNNYRATGGGDHIKDAEMVLSTADENRNIIIDYISKMGVINPQEENNWSILPVETAGRLIFRSSPLGKDYIESEGLTNVTYIGEEEEWGLYTYNFPTVDDSEPAEVTIPDIVEVVQEEMTESTTAKVHVVQSGDNLWKIAKEYYGDGNYYHQIFEANQEKIKQAALIYPGQELVLP